MTHGYTCLSLAQIYSGKFSNVPYEYSGKQTIPQDSYWTSMMSRYMHLPPHVKQFNHEGNMSLLGWKSQSTQTLEVNNNTSGLDQQSELLTDE